MPGVEDLGFSWVLGCSVAEAVHLDSNASDWAVAARGLVELDMMS